MLPEQSALQLPGTTSATPSGPVDTGSAVNAEATTCPERLATRPLPQVPGSCLAQRGADNASNLHSNVQLAVGRPTTPIKRAQPPPTTTTPSWQPPAPAESNGVGAAEPSDEERAAPVRSVSNNSKFVVTLKKNAQTAKVRTRKRLALSTFQVRRGSLYEDAASEAWAGGFLFQLSKGDSPMDMENGTQGQLEFVHGRKVLDWHAPNKEEASQAKFVRLQTQSGRFTDLNGEDQKARVNILRDLVEFMKRSWEMRIPSVIFSVTGSASPFTLRPLFHARFQAALRHAIRSTNALIVSVGTDTGIGRLVGEVLAEERGGVPSMAILSWNVVDGRSALKPAPIEDEIEHDQTLKTGIGSSGSYREGIGSGRAPFVYSGQFTPSEGQRGAKMNPNYSYYILVDDGSEHDLEIQNSAERWGREIPFRSELLDFISFRHDAATGSITKLTESIRAQSTSSTEAKVQSNVESMRCVPIIGLVVGGGPNTINTIIEDFIDHSAPVIIFGGTGRAAKVIAEWYQLTAEASALREAGGDLSTVLEAQTRLLRVWLLSGEELQISKSKLPENSEQKQVFDGRIAAMHKQMDAIATYPHLHFYDISSNKTINSHKQDFLLLVLRSIFMSKAVKPQVQLPLAVRYNDTDALRQILDAQGLLKLDGTERHQELSADSRPLVFAAFHDCANTVSQLVSAGFEIGQLDHLILLEIRQLLELSAIHRAAKGSKWWLPCERCSGTGSSLEYEPPLEWKESEERVAKKQYVDAGGQDFIDLPKVRQEEIISEKWHTLPRSKQAQIVIGSIKRVTWNKLRLLDGWTYKAIEYVPDRHSNSEREWQIPLGKIFRQSGMIRSVDGSITIEFVPADREQCHTALFQGQLASEKDMQSLAVILPALNYCAWQCQTWAIIKEEGQGKVLMQQISNDEVIASLDEFNPSFEAWRSRDSSLYAAGCAAFATWLPSDDIARDQKLGHDGISACTDIYEPRKPLDPLLRLYWAVVTGRNGMAELLWQQHERPFVSAFLCGKICRLGTIDLQAQADMWDKKTLDMLCFLEENAGVGGETLGTLFDEYIYSADTPRKQMQTLKLFGVRDHTAATRLDLAVLSENKLFVGHVTTTNFLYKTWTKKCGNGTWMGRISKATPRTTHAVKLIGYVLFVAYFIAVHIRMPTRVAAPEPLEVGFWCWMLTFVVDDVAQAQASFRGARHYFFDTGYTRIHRLAINVVFVAALICRLTGDPSLYTVMYLLLTINLFFVHMKLIVLFAFIKRVGILHIIVRKIIARDVLPFLLYLFLVTVCFEISAGSFSWVLETESYRHHHRFWLTNTIIIMMQDVRLDRNVIITSLSGVDPGIPDYRPAEYDGSSHGSGAGDQQILAINVMLCREIFNSMFWLLAVVILMNLLIAMMSDTFSDITAAATEEWNIIFAGIVRESFDATLLPAPLNVIELVTNYVMHGLGSREYKDGFHQESWGQHYVWPRFSPRKGERLAQQFIIDRDGLLLSTPSKPEEGSASSYVW